jgi:KipI family sensor histidine kinase inhibitor
MQVKLLYAGETAVVIEFGNEISESINRQLTFVVNALDKAKNAGHIAGIRDLLPTYRSILVSFDPLRISAQEIFDEAAKAFTAYSATDASGGGEVIEIPVLYGGEAGPDLDHIAQHTGFSTDEVIKRHSSPEYLIYMIGFTPGFPYLGGMPKEIATPRLTTPRQIIPAGSVGIAGEQTGIYPMESPGGWQLLGRTPLKVFDSAREEPFLLNAGQYLKFVPISEDEFRQITADPGACSPKRYQRRNV